MSNAVWGMHIAIVGGGLAIFLMVRGTLARNKKGKRAMRSGAFILIFGIFIVLSVLVLQLFPINYHAPDQVVFGESIYANGADGVRLTTLNANDGSLYWRHRFDITMSGDDIIQNGGIAYLVGIPRGGNEDIIRAVRMRDGVQLWQVPLPLSTFSLPSHGGYNGPFAVQLLVTNGFILGFVNCSAI